MDVDMLRVYWVCSVRCMCTRCTMCARCIMCTRCTRCARCTRCTWCVQSLIAACHRFVRCKKTRMFGSLFTRCSTHCACHTKRRWNVQKWSEQVVLLPFWLGHVLCARTAALFQHLNFQKCSDNGVLYVLSSKCASRHNPAHFFGISTSKSGPRPPVFNTFDFEMCFAPQRRALFRHLNF